MREVFYWATGDGHPPTHILAGRVALAGYEAVAGQNDPAITYFKSIPILVDSTLPRNVMHFMHNGRIVGQVVEIS